GITKLKAVGDALMPPSVHDLVIHDSTTLDAQLGVPMTGSTDPGLDNPGMMAGLKGVIHDQIGYIIHGSFNGPNYLSAATAENGTFTLDATGAPMVKSMQPIRFTLILPARFSGTQQLPVVIFQYGLQQDRHYVYGMANALAAQGIAILAPDL